MCWFSGGGGTYETLMVKPHLTIRPKSREDTYVLSSLHPAWLISSETAVPLTSYLSGYILHPSVTMPPNTPYVVHDAVRAGGKSHEAMAEQAIFPAIDVW